MSENYRRPDYDRYIFSIKEIVRYVLEGFLIVAVVSYFFYRSVVIALLISPAVIFYLKMKKDELCKQRKRRLNLQFKDALKSINDSLQAGYSMENAFVEAYRDMVEYHGADSLIAKELAGIRSGIRNNMPVEDLMDDMGKRSGVEDIQDFAGILRVGKQSGGNLSTLFENSMLVMEEKIAVKEEIQTLISAKKLESRIMCIIPFGIIFYLDMTSKGYFDALYADMAGHIIMTICLGIYIFAVRMMERIMDIEI